MSMEKMRCKTVVCMLFCICFCPVWGQSRVEFILEIDSAHSCMVEQRYDDALAFYMKAFACYPSKNPVYWFEASSVAGRLKQETLSSLLLNQAIDKGFSLADIFKKSSAYLVLDSLKQEPFLMRIQKQDSLMNYLTEVLDTVFVKDQRERVQFMANPKVMPEEVNARMGKMDLANQNVVRNLISLYGFWGESLKSPTAKYAMWLVLVHAPREIQEEYMPVLCDAVDRGELYLMNVAYNEDKILYAKSGFQKYGTQYKLVDGELQVLPLIEPDSVNVYRKRVGLNTLDEYLKEVKKMNVR